MEQQGEDSPLTENVEKSKESDLENIIELKGLKAKAKSEFTKARRTLLVLIQQTQHLMPYREVVKFWIRHKRKLWKL